MFFDALQSALTVLNHGDTVSVITLYLLLMLTPFMVVFLIMKKSHVLSLRYFRKLLLPFLEAIAAALAVLTLFPIIFGLGDDALWNFPFKAMQVSPGGFAGLLSILIVLAYVIDIIPSLRKLQSFKTLILGGVCLMFARFFLSYINPMIEVDLESFVPGFWFICGVLLISIALSRLGHFVFASFASTLGSRFNMREEVAELLILPIIATLGFLPVFIYGAWLA
jgi:hypothetical protein